MVNIRLFIIHIIFEFSTNLHLAKAVRDMNEESQPQLGLLINLTMAVIRIRDLRCSSLPATMNQLDLLHKKRQDVSRLLLSNLVPIQQIRCTRSERKVLLTSNKYRVSSDRRKVPATALWLRSKWGGILRVQLRNT